MTDSPFSSWLSRAPKLSVPSTVISLASTPGSVWLAFAGTGTMVTSITSAKNKLSTLFIAVPPAHFFPFYLYHIKKHFSIV